MTFLGRESVEVDALVTDRYLESLLAGHAPAPGGGGQASAAVRGAVALDADVRLAIDRLGRDLPRFHPSFRFEERLADRLAQLATAMRFPAAAGAEGVVIPFGGFDPGPDVLVDLADPDDPRDSARQLLLGGALTSAALSLAGVAWVAWRRSRPAGSPMARAVRALNAARTRPD